LRRDDLYLADIVESADAIAGFIASVGETRFVSDDLLRSAVLQKLTVIGEAAARISEDVRRRNPAVPWRDIIAFRNIAVHRYFGIDWHVVWNAATIDVPSLREQIVTIIASQNEGDNRS
jgi:uncharacterized protein with HEPN domain